MNTVRDVTTLIWTKYFIPNDVFQIIPCVNNLLTAASNQRAQIDWNSMSYFLEIGALFLICMRRSVGTYCFTNILSDGNGDGNWRTQRRSVFPV